MITLAVFAQIINFEFLIWDDDEFVVRHVRRLGELSLNNFVWSFQNRENGWRTPLPYLSLFADASVFGFSSAGCHLSNLLIHWLTVVLLFDALLLMTARFWPSFAAAAIFAIHPMHVEPVAWVTGRWELLCGFFWVLGMLAYAKYCVKPTLVRGSFVLLAYGCAIASKPMALTFPFALLLLDYWPLQRVNLFPTNADKTNSNDSENRQANRRAVWEKVPLFVMMFCSLGIVYVSKSSFVGSLPLQRFSWSEKLLGGIEAYATYALQFAWPAGLSFYYPHPAILDGFSAWRIIAAASLLIGVTAIVLLCRRQRFLLVGWCWFLGTLVPAIGIVQVEHHARADRYAYIPVIGLILMGCWGVTHLGTRFAWPKIVLPAIIFGSLLGFAVISWRQASYWRNSETLFLRGVQVDERNFKAWHGLGTLALRQGDFNQAAQHFDRAARVFHGFGSHDFLLGSVAFAQADYEQAIEKCEQALAYYPDSKHFRRLLARCYEMTGEHECAAEAYGEMLRRAPEDPFALYWFGEYLTRHHEKEEAIQYFRRTLRCDPYHEQAPIAIGLALEDLGRPREAIDFYTNHLASFPFRTSAKQRLAWLLATHPDATIRDPARAFQLARQVHDEGAPTDAVKSDTLAVSLAANGNFSEAEKATENAICVAKSNGDIEHLMALEERIALYRQGKSYLSDRCQGDE